MTVYLDEVFLVNLVMDWLILWAVGNFAQCHASNWRLMLAISQPGGLAEEKQVGSAGALRPLEAVLSKADARPFLLPSIPSTWASASLIALLRSL